ncbi:Lrp/AsnC family transcriptional regulator [Micrococcus flavus]|nr:AsnC family transcriptional regulator [Micrococcus flavus]
MVRMDATDRQILTHLQREGRISINDLAERVNLTSAPTSRRVRELERSGAIRGYRADVDPAALGLGFEALVHVTMNLEDTATLAEFERALAQIPEMRHAERLFGDPDYLLRVVARDIEDFADLRDQRIAALPGVGQVTSTIVMRTIVDNQPLPTPRERRRR